ncbi:unnamed protein product [Candidula unifasciata]|uniref:Uncharacterized protein n=1 Tax=Candidula unifasciata TaxID=100452 RepID=A0A8S3ZZB8_9EUPU|nr:unnamed protein product [Candidula unifasciata]
MSLRENFSEAGGIVKLAFVVVITSLCCSWLAFTTTSWLVVKQTHYGLWRVCAETVSGCSHIDGTANVEYGVTQAFAIIGFMCQNLAFFLIVRFIFKENCRGNTDIGMGSAALLIVSAIGWLIAVAVFGDEFDATGAKLHYSYGLAVVASGLGLIGGVLMIIGGSNGSVGSK